LEGLERCHEDLTGLDELREDEDGVEFRRSSVIMRVAAMERDETGIAAKVKRGGVVADERNGSR
jgi:hypothetical protein